MKSPVLALAAGGLLVAAGLFVILRDPDGGDPSSTGGDPGTSTAYGTKSERTAGGGGTRSGPRTGSPGNPGGDDFGGDGPGRAGDRNPAAAAAAEAARSRQAMLQKILEKKREGITVFDKDYKLNPELAEALGLSEAEFSMLNQTLLDSLEQIDDLRAENVEVRQKSDSQLFLKIRSFEEEGAAVQASLEDSLRQQLGDERYASFMLMSGDSLTDQYFDFGRAYQTISFNVYDSQNDGARRIRIVDRLHVPQDNGEWAVIENKDNFNTLPPGYAPFFDLANSGAPNPIDPSLLPQPTPAPNPEGGSQ